MRDSRAPRGTEWGDVVEALHCVLNVITVRSQYPAGHPAIGRADEVAALNLTRALTSVPELVVALIDGELVVCERPLPDLRQRLAGLADAMVAHEIDCLVFQAGVNRNECGTLAEILAQPFDPVDPTRAREQAKASLRHVLLRFAELRAQSQVDDAESGAEYFVPQVGDALATLVRAMMKGSAVAPHEVRELAARIVARCAARAFAVPQRCFARGIDDSAAHATNVATLTAAMALAAGHGERTCIEVTAAALVHDVGHFFFPPELAGVPEPLLDDRSRLVFRQHPFLGARALLASGCPPLWAAVALEHHRGVDGRGYPGVGSGERPDALVNLVALANYFDRRRTILDGKADTPEVALGQAAALEGRYFERPTLAAFLRAVGVFPPGTTIELSDRSSAIVLRASPTDPLRPEVCLLSGPHTGRRVDLKAFNALDKRYELSIARATPPPLACLLEPYVAAEPPPSSRPSPPIPVALPVQISLVPIPRSLMPAMPSMSYPPAPTISEAPARLSRSDARADEDDAPFVAAPRSARPSALPVADAAPPSAGLEVVLALAISPAELKLLPLDARTGFVLSLIDGVSPLETIVDACGLPADDVVAIASDLERRGVLTRK